MTPTQYEDERLKLKAERISARFHARVAELAALRTRGEVEARPRGGPSWDGLARGWSDADWLDSGLRSVLLRRSRPLRNLGRSYTSTLNGVPFAVLPSGRIVINDEGVK